MFCDENCVNMLRNILERQNERNRGINGAEGGASTPLRGSYSGPPRTRLTFKQSRLEPVPVYSLPPPVPKQTQALPKKFYFRSGQNNPGQSDRFIPVRRGQNFELAKYNLMKGDAENEIDAASNYLDIVSQINSLESIWRKRIMMSAFKRHDIILGAGNQKILNMGMKRMERYGELNEWRRGTRDSVVDEYQESIWKVKPRNRPLLGEHHQKIKIPNRSRVAYRGAIDWSSKDCIVAQVNYDLHFFTMTEAKKAHISISVESSYSGSRTIRCLKWNQAGDKIVMYSRSLTICVFDVPSSKVLWSEECVCDNCEIMCMSWSMNDDEIVVGCTEGKLCLFRSRGLARNRLIEQVQSHKGPLLTLAVSTNNRYLATTGIDKVVKIYLFPAMLLYLEIGYYDAPQAFAWHPWESGTLCIGGGQGDGSLSLWDMRRQESLGYKRVAFVGHVKNMKWNKISGELVVQWYYWEGDKRFVTVPVLASWDRVVDVAQWDSTRYGDNVANIIWNPDHTKIGIQVMNAILIWNFFAYQESEWRTKSNEEAKKKFTANISSCFNKCCIR